VINYEVRIFNDGNVDLTHVVAVDPMGGGTLTLTSGDADHDGILNVGETWVYDYTATATQGELDSGAPIVNVVTASSDQIPSATANATVTVDQDPGLTISKAVATTASGAGDGSTADHVGQEIDYTVVVTNTGNIDLTGVTVTDGFVALSSQSSTLAVG